MISKGKVLVVGLEFEFLLALLALVFHFYELKFGLDHGRIGLKDQSTDFSQCRVLNVFNDKSATTFRHALMNHVTIPQALINRDVWNILHSRTYVRLLVFKFIVKYSDTFIFSLFIVNIFKYSGVKIYTD